MIIYTKFVNKFYKILKSIFKICLSTIHISTKVFPRKLLVVYFRQSFQVTIMLSVAIRKYFTYLTDKECKKEYSYSKCIVLNTILRVQQMTVWHIIVEYRCMLEKLVFNWIWTISYLLPCSMGPIIFYIVSFFRSNLNAYFRSWIGASKFVDWC